jgi:hypothetical protein
MGTLDSAVPQRSELIDGYCDGTPRDCADVTVPLMSCEIRYTLSYYRESPVRKYTS